ncbi:monoheme cytochrome SoxX (sulfur oxidation) [Hydrogenivirga caldilitoris]|uniref:Monoheme cytochrome SoxX (Sulfur oxidation) n=1 Tax=Hydrogenivirga caldilitoris TaxID=246264 RepID=A0A497XR38_9AQUI|nr:sulfur oxidation c-type cytochrome SoxX [Hydrogenivirga caldilitoris]RLJ71445.1 monoheme cytochrome SoxX (sulfur oxidation) [Hydrogenivirga caldilitoris]
MKKFLFTGVILGTGLLVACQPAAQQAEAPKAEEKKLSAKEKFEIALANQDKYQKACSNPNQLVPEGIDLETFKKEMLATVKFPEGGVVGKDIAKGEKLFGDPKKGGKSRRGNCYACHCGDPQIIACGNIGPSLRGYGKRGIDPKDTYIRIYNSWAVNPCSVMPRLGYHGVLKPEEIADIVAYMHDPNSPLNK